MAIPFAERSAAGSAARASSSSARLSMMAAATLLCALAGCCNPKGFILRGDWSIEMNRVPWLAGHGAEYESCDDDSTGHECAGASCTHAHRGENCKSAPCVRQPVQESAESVHSAVESETPPAEHGAHRSVTPAAPVRFHPLPTRPVFGYRIQRTAAAESSEESPETESVEQQPGRAHASDAPASRQARRPKQKAPIKRRKRQG